MVKAPFSFVSLKIIGIPLQLRGNLLRFHQGLQGAQPRIGRCLENRRRRPDALEDAAQLAEAALGRPLALDARQMLPDLVEADAVAAVVAAIVAELDLAAGEDPGRRLGDLADAVVLLVVAD